jgi:hypothetical protein
VLSSVGARGVADAVLQQHAHEPATRDESDRQHTELLRLTRTALFKKDKETA